MALNDAQLGSKFPFLCRSAQQMNGKGKAHHPGYTVERILVISITTPGTGKVPKDESIQQVVTVM
jgi:hypothetical protein